MKKDQKNVKKNRLQRTQYRIRIKNAKNLNMKLTYMENHQDGIYKRSSY